jgi:hypothetical protein
MEHIKYVGVILRLMYEFHLVMGIFGGYTKSTVMLQIMLCTLSDQGTVYIRMYV